MLALLRSAPNASAADSFVAALSALPSRVGPAQVAAGRAGIGAAMIVRPRALPGLLGVDSATSARMSWAMQMLGARDIAVGVGTLVALRNGNDVAARTWIAAGVLCDVADALVVGAGLVRRRLPAAAGATTFAMAVGAASSGSRELQTRS